MRRRWRARAQPSSRRRRRLSPHRLATWGEQHGENPAERPGVDECFSRPAAAGPCRHMHALQWRRQDPLLALPGRGHADMRSMCGPGLGPVHDLQRQGRSHLRHLQGHAHGRDAQGTQDPRRGERKGHCRACAGDGGVRDMRRQWDRHVCALRRQDRDHLYHLPRAKNDPVRQMPGRRIAGLPDMRRRRPAAFHDDAVVFNQGRVRNDGARGRR